MRARALAGVLLLAGPLLAAGPAAAERLWVRDEVRINVRSGPGTGHGVVGLVKTGDALEVLSRGDGWLRIRTPDGTEGWMPAGYLEPEPPAAARLAEQEREVERLREQIEALRAEPGTAAAEPPGDGGPDPAVVADLREELEALREENRRLRVEGGGGGRGAEWIAGALILGSGMAIGALLARSTARRQPRVRL